MIDIPSCVAEASATYHIQANRIQAMIAHGLPNGAFDGSRIGVMGIPVDWLPIFENAGISGQEIRDDPCQNIIVGTWIIAYQDEWNRFQNPYSPAYLKNAQLFKRLASKRALWTNVVRQAAAHSGVPEALIHSVITQESRYNPAALSPKGAIGMMQLMPKTAEMLGVNPYDPVQNIYGGARYLAGLLRQFNGNLELALASYNAGPATVARHGYKVPAFKETRAYLTNVIGNYQHLSSP